MKVMYKESITGRLILNDVLLNEFNNIASEVGGTNVILIALKEYLSYNYFMRTNQLLNPDQQKVELVKPRGSYKVKKRGATCAYRLNLSSILIDEYNHLLKEVGDRQQILIKALEEYLSLSFKSNRNLTMEIKTLKSESMIANSSCTSSRDSSNDRNYSDEIVVTLDTNQTIQNKDEGVHAFSEDVNLSANQKSDSSSIMNKDEAMVNKSLELSAEESSKTKADSFDIKAVFPEIEDNLFDDEENAANKKIETLEIAKNDKLKSQGTELAKQPTKNESKSNSEKISIDMSDFWS